MDGTGVHVDRLTQLVRGTSKPPESRSRGACHLFRHTMATLMLEGGADIRYIQAMLGHADVSTTQIYTQVSIRALQAIHAATHPAATTDPEAARARRERDGRRDELIGDAARSRAVTALEGVLDQEKEEENRAHPGSPDPDDPSCDPGHGPGPGRDFADDAPGPGSKPATGSDGGSGTSYDRAQAVGVGVGRYRGRGDPGSGARHPPGPRRTDLPSGRLRTPRHLGVAGRLPAAGPGPDEHVLTGELAAGRVVIVAGDQAGNPGAVIGEAAAILDRAQASAAGLARDLDAAQSALVWAGAPDPAPGPGPGRGSG